MIKVFEGYKKTKLVLANFSTHTHPNREILLRAISDLSFITMSQNLGYEAYLEQMALHKFYFVLAEMASIQIAFGGAVPKYHTNYFSSRLDAIVFEFTHSCFGGLLAMMQN